MSPIAGDRRPETLFAKLERPVLLVFGVILAAQVIYLWTLAPTVLWGDDAKLQIQAYELDITVDSQADHPLWVLLAHPFVRLPIGNPAYRANLFTSLCAAIAVGFSFAAMRRFNGSTIAAITGAAALTVSHSFWTHAVRTEVYSLNLLVLAASIYLLVTAAEARWRLLAAWFLLGLGVVHHVMLWVVVPGLFYFSWHIYRRAASKYRSLVMALLFFAIPQLVIKILMDAAPGPNLDPLAYVPTLRTFSRESAKLVLYLGLQYPSPAALLAVLGGIAGLRQSPMGVALLLIFLANIAAAINLTFPDKYVFYNLAYFAVAFWAAYGMAGLVKIRPQIRSRPYVVAFLLASVLLMPPVVYTALPHVLPAFGITGDTLGIREIPGRPALAYFLNPSKRGYTGAAWFATAALEDLPPNATIIADYTVAMPMMYLQQVEGLRPDVQIASLAGSDQIPFAIQSAENGPVFLALTGKYYDTETLSEYFTIEPAGAVHRLSLR